MSSRADQPTQPRTLDVLVIDDPLAVAGRDVVAARVVIPVPIVFTLVSDPVGAGVVNSLARPDGNATGFMLYEYSLSGKWLELLKQIAPRTTRAAVSLSAPLAFKSPHKQKV